MLTYALRMCCGCAADALRMQVMERMDAQVDSHLERSDVC
jgi:hypothetical protein